MRVVLFHTILINFFVSLGDITQKGYEKKRAKLLARYIPLIQGKRVPHVKSLKTAL